MYQFSRAIYRELAGEIIEDRQWRRRSDEPRARAARLRGGRRSGSPPTGTTSRGPSRTLFNDIRVYFPMSRAAATSTASSTATSSFAGEYLAAQPDAGFDAQRQELECRATTRKGTPCQRMPLPHNGYCPSHQHLAETEDERRARGHEAVPLTRTRAPAMLLGVDVGGTFTDAVARRRRPAGHGEGADDAATTSPRACWPRSAPRSSAPGADAGDVERVRARHDRRDERAARGPRRAHRARRDRGLHGRRRARPPGARRPLPPVRRAPGAARPAGAARRRARAHGARRRAARARGRRRARRRRGRRARARGGRRLPAARLPPPRARARARRRRCASACPASTSRSRTRSSARSASTSARRRPRSTPRSRRCSRAYLRRAASARARGRGPARAGDHAVHRRAGRRSTQAARPRGADRALRPGGRRRRRRAGRAPRPASPTSLCFDMGGTSCDVCVIEGGARARDRRAARSAAARSRCRCSTSTRSAPAAARSPGATRAARCASGRARPARGPGPPCYGRGGDRADGHRREPRARPARHRRAAGRRRSRSTPRRPRARSARSAGELGLEPLEACAEGIVRVANAEMVRALRVMTVERGVDPRELRAAARSAAPGRCTPRRSPRSSA